MDAALFEDKDQYGVGMVARNHIGQLIEARIWFREGSVAPELAKIMGIREAVIWIKQRRWWNATLGTDCLVAINAIRSRIIMFSPFGLVDDECQRCLNV